MAKTLSPGEAILLYGDIGAGKSVLVRGIVHGLPGGEGLIVRSPTFVYVRHYPTRPPVQHVDLYRLPMGTPPEEIGLDEWADAGSVTIIEWAQRLSGRKFSKCTEVRIESLGGDRRRMEILRKQGL